MGADRVSSLERKERIDVAIGARDVRLRSGWRASRCGAGGAQIVASFKGLKPGGTYSLFENHFDTTPISFTPLDGKGTRNSFKAKRDGSASVSVRSPDMPTGVNTVLLVYHSDGKSHGESRGLIGVNRITS